MAKYITRSSKLLTCLFVLGTLFTACGNSNSPNPKGNSDSEDLSRSGIRSLVDTTIADNSLGRIDDTASTMTATHTGTIAPGTNVNAGPAKPDPAKKGLKGIVTAKPELVAGKVAKQEADASGVYSAVDVVAAFPNGTSGLQSYFDKNIQYPARAHNEGVEGTVRVTFVVDENGKLISPQVTSENMGYGLEEEALRVIKRMPAWTPAKIKGKNVKTRMTLPIKFQLI